MKVFYVESLSDDTPIIYGETNGHQINDHLLVKVDGRDQQIYSAYVFLDTPENLKELQVHRQAYKAWKAQAPNIHALLNKLKRPGRQP